MDLDTRVVAPLFEASSGHASERYAPDVIIRGARFIVAVHLPIALRRKDLGPIVASLADEAQRIRRAIDRVFFGV